MCCIFLWSIFFFPCVFTYSSPYLSRETKQQRFTISKMSDILSLSSRLASRELVHPGELDYALECRARMHRAGARYSPVYPRDRMFPGTYYLNGINSDWLRTYGRTPVDHVPQPLMPPQGETNASQQYVTLAPPIVIRLARKIEVSTPVTGMLSVMASKSDLPTSSRRRIACVITGVAAGLPGKDGPVFRSNNLTRLIEGDQCIGQISGSIRAAMMDKNIVQLVKEKDGTRVRKPVNTEADGIKLAAQLGDLNLSKDYGIPPGLAETMDLAAQVAVASGLEALKNARLLTGRTGDPNEWSLPEQYRDSTGVVYASSFPAMDAAVGEVMRFLQSKTVGAAAAERLVTGLRNRLVRASPDRVLGDDDEAALARLLARAREADGGGGISDEAVERSTYEFDRKFLFRVLVLGNAQLAQIAGCRGPNTQTNAACAGTTQAIAMAQDMLISGRAQRVVVVAGDNASGDTLIPWLGSGFRVLGAATTKGVVKEAAVPFDKRRSGMLLGAGGIGMVLETEDSAQLRMEKYPDNKDIIKARLLATQYSNSAFHGAALCRKHIASELKRFLTDVEVIHGINKSEIATHGVYLSHETSTHASAAQSCSGNEITALRDAFGDKLTSKILIVNTKGFTGHPMGVSFEDVAAVEILLRQRVPPVVNYKEKDEYLGTIKLSKGGAYACRYALRFAAGFGSQVVFALYATTKE
uniref:beta-ketoacyl-[acyl-carrier-protein] synthase I n=1 Tax=Corethron hystrix TaxID=216773 RepID=A0A7S1B9C4_9STRA|mmetsp:Transcript_16491/g.37057  ORF Transcript_16491/g.37057 Transcript_16491/m.37057 type:complete len:698 (+) Transcript_16491:1667-3760(+)